MSLSKSVQFGQLCTVNFATENEWIQWWKAALNPLVSIWSVSFEFSFCGGNTRFTYVFAVSTSKLSQLQNKKNWIYLQYLSLPFTYWTEVNLRTFINRRWEWIILSVRSLTAMEKDSVVTVLAKLVPLFFQKCTCAFFFLKRSPIDRCQIVTDTCKNNVSKFVWKPFKSPLSLRKWKCFGEAPLFNFAYLYFN